jgi:glutaredoxin
MNKRIVIYTKPDCSYCVDAKSVLKNNNIPFEEKTLNLDFTREYLLEEYPSAKTFPVIVINEKYIGGYTELVNYMNADFFN